MNELKQHLDQLGLDADLILKHLPETLTLSLKDGVLFAHDENQQHIHVDFLHGKIAYRAAQHIGGEYLIKACRLKSQKHVRVLDATCGMGRDSFILYQDGFEVLATEQNPLTHALLTDGLQRYFAATGHMPFQLYLQTAEKIMAEQSFDVIYLDPMFPEKTKSAKSKKDMQLFHLIHQNAEDNAMDLLNLALEADCQRVVIKRPLRAKPLIARKPTFEIAGKSCRFESYQTK